MCVLFMCLAEYSMHRSAVCILLAVQLFCAELLVHVFPSGQDTQSRAPGVCQQCQVGRNASRWSTASY